MRPGGVASAGRVVVGGVVGQALGVAVDLANGARFTSFPNTVLESLLTDIVGTWRRKGVEGELVIEVTGAAPVIVGDRVIDPRVVRGPLAGVVRWAAGRGTVGVSANGTVPPPPPWL